MDHAIYCLTYKIHNYYVDRMMELEYKLDHTKSDICRQVGIKLFKIIKEAMEK